MELRTQSGNEEKTSMMWNYYGGWTWLWMAGTMIVICTGVVLLVILAFMAGRRARA